MVKSKKNGKTRSPFLYGVMTGAALTLAISACSPTVETRGNLIIQNKLADIQPDMSTRSDVELKWGPPTAVAAFDNKTWYYIGEQTETMGILKSEIKERRIIAVHFNDADIVTGVEPLDPAKGREISFVERKTPTAGKEFNVFQQLIGNVGRFNADSLQKPKSAP